MDEWTVRKRDVIITIIIAEALAFGLGLLAGWVIWG